MKEAGNTHPPRRHHGSLERLAYPPRRGPPRLVLAGLAAALVVTSILFPQEHEDDIPIKLSVNCLGVPRHSVAETFGDMQTRLVSLEVDDMPRGAIRLRSGQISLPGKPFESYPLGAVVETLGTAAVRAGVLSSDGDYIDVRDGITLSCVT